MNKLRKKHQIQLPKPSSSTASSTDDVLNGNSKLLNKFNQDSDIYIRANTQFVNRKYEPLCEQVANMTQSFDELKRNKKVGTDAYIMESNTHDDYLDDSRIGKPRYDNKKPMKLHEHWSYYFDGNDGCMFSEAETWNVVAHVNRRHSYGKSLRYSDRFYRNWAIQVAEQEEDERATQARDHKGDMNLPGRDGFK